MALEVQTLQKPNSRTDEEQNHPTLWTIQNNLGLADFDFSALHCY